MDDHESETSETVQDEADNTLIDHESTKLNVNVDCTDLHSDESVNDTTCDASMVEEELFSDNSYLLDVSVCSTKKNIRLKRKNKPSCASTSDVYAIEMAVDTQVYRRDDKAQSTTCDTNYEELSVNKERCRSFVFPENGPQAPDNLRNQLFSVLGNKFGQEKKLVPAKEMNFGSSDKDNLACSPNITEFKLRPTQNKQTCRPKSDIVHDSSSKVVDFRSVLKQNKANLAVEKDIDPNNVKEQSKPVEPVSDVKTFLKPVTVGKPVDVEGESSKESSEVVSDFRSVLKPKPPPKDRVSTEQSKPVEPVSDVKTFLKPVTVGKPVDVEGESSKASSEVVSDFRSVLKPKPPPKDRVSTDVDPNHVKEQSKPVEPVSDVKTFLKPVTVGKPIDVENSESSKESSEVVSDFRSVLKPKPPPKERVTTEVDNNKKTELEENKGTFSWKAKLSSEKKDPKSTTINPVSNMGSTQNINKTGFNVTLKSVSASNKTNISTPNTSNETNDNPAFKVSLKPVATPKGSINLGTQNDTAAEDNNKINGFGLSLKPVPTSVNTSSSSSSISNPTNDNSPQGKFNIALKPVSANKPQLNAGQQSSNNEGKSELDNVFKMRNLKNTTNVENDSNLNE